MCEFWRIDELQTVTEQALAAAIPDADLSGRSLPENRRVRAVPDARTIRYYTTLGLLDRAAEMRGRTAFYSRRHVLQLVCIKRLQVAGLSLEEVQQKLTGATTPELVKLAALPERFWEQPFGDKQREKPADEPLAAPPPQRANFWAEPPAIAPEIPLAAPIACLRLPVAAGVALEIAGVDISQVTPAALAALQPVLETLSQELNRLGLLSSPTNPRPSPSVSTSSSSTQSESASTHLNSSGDSP